MQVVKLRGEKLAAISLPLVVPPEGYGFQFSDNEGAKQVVLFGDSRIHQWEYEWPSDLEIIKAGVSGSTSYQALTRLDTILELKPDGVLLQVGVNDIVASRMVLGQFRKAVLHDAIENIVKISTKITESGIKLVVMTVVPEINVDFARYLFWQGSLEPAANYINAELKSRLPSNVVMINSDKYFKHADGRWRKDFSKDALHWNSMAYNALSSDLIEIFRDM
ncbi:MAG: SGNH/GDSL hydrolase family protein [Cellvibrionaceae bacterium]